MSHQSIRKVISLISPILLSIVGKVLKNKSYTIMCFIFLGATVFLLTNNQANLQYSTILQLVDIYNSFYKALDEGNTLVNV